MNDRECVEWILKRWRIAQHFKLSIGFLAQITRCYCLVEKVRNQWIFSTRMKGDICINWLMPQQPRYSELQTAFGRTLASPGSTQGLRLVLRCCRRPEESFWRTSAGVSLLLCEVETNGGCRFSAAHGPVSLVHLLLSTAVGGSVMLSLTWTLQYCFVSGWEFMHQIRCRRMMILSPGHRVTMFFWCSNGHPSCRVWL